MARSIQEIKGQIMSSIANDSNLQDLNSTSSVSIYGAFAYIIAFAINQLELFFDIHSKQVDTAIYESKPGTARWYRNKSLAFQFGFDLLTDDDEFDNNGATPEQIEESKIVKYCSVKEALESSRLIIKVAGDDGNNLIPLTNIQIDSFKYYMSEIAYAGVKINVVNNPADKLLLGIQVFRNPLVIDENGNNILTGGRTVEKAIEDYIKNLPFDGELVINDLIDYLRDVDGVINVHIFSAMSSYKDIVLDEYTPFEAITIKTIPVAGYFEIENFDNLSYVV